MSNFELIDDYLGNRLNEADRKAFEQQVQGDPSLKSEVDFQRQIIESVKQARVTELKAMLSNVPVGGSMWSGTKLAASIVSAGLVSTVLYFYLNGDPATVVMEDNQPKEEVVIPADATTLKEEPIGSMPVVKDSTQAEDQTVVIDKKKSIKTNQVPSPVHKPDLDLVDPSIDLADSGKGKIDPAINTKTEGDISVSKMDVITGLTDKKHNFHYQFSEGKLKLYGPFDRSLYEILEIHGVTHAVFLFYKENYYLMNEDQTEITPLQLIKDAQLLKKLKEYRGR
ncbi:hypothetical protein BH09BAC3_BH09BAC3_11520 [soil metagenome]